MKVAMNEIWDLVQPNQHGSMVRGRARGGKGSLQWTNAWPWGHVPPKSPHLDPPPPTNQPSRTPPPPGKPPEPLPEPPLPTPPPRGLQPTVSWGGCWGPESRSRLPCERAVSCFNITKRHWNASGLSGGGACPAQRTGRGLRSRDMLCVRPTGRVFVCVCVCVLVCVGGGGEVLGGWVSTAPSGGDGKFFGVWVLMGSQHGCIRVGGCLCPLSCPAHFFSHSDPCFPHRE